MWTTKEESKAHCRPSPPFATKTSSNNSDVPLTISKDAKVKYSVIDGTPGLSIATNRTHTWTQVASRTRARTIASFPGRSCLQFLIAYCMQNGGGRPGRKSHVRDVR